MRRFGIPHQLDRSILRRAAGALACLVLAGVIAAGCGGDDGGGGDPASIQSEDGPLAWLPADTWLVASVDASVEDIDTAIGTLERLPAWSLTESFLPADDGAGLRRALLQELAKQSKGAGDRAVSAKRLEAAFGDRLGFAITNADFESWEDGNFETLPYQVWIEVDDRDAAASVLTDLTTGADTESEHEGHEMWASKENDFAFTIDEDLAVIATSKAHLERAIDLREGDESLAEDDTARAVIEAGASNAFVGVAVQTDPLLEAVPGLVEADADADDPKDVAKAKAIAEDLGPVLRSPEVDGLVADWMATSTTIDGTGLRFRGAWSNPRELAEPDVGSRELAERMPSDAPTVSAMVSDGSGLGRVQAAWAEARDAYDLDLRSFIAECQPDAKVFCELAIEGALAVLEDEDLAESLEERGETTRAYVQDIGAALASATPAGAQTLAAQERSFEMATTAEPFTWIPPAELATAMRTAGLIVLPKPNGDITIRVVPGSPLAAWLRDFERGAKSRPDGAGFSLGTLLTSGITLTYEEADGIRVTGFPQDAPSKVVPAIEGDIDTLADSPVYQEVVEAANPPKQVGAYGWVDVSTYVEAILGVVAASEPDVKRVIPMVRNNLADAPGIVWWSTREDIDGVQVGVAEMAMPILE